ncbi:MAG: hypothetical protein GY707_05540 [Desulfobacteraceae bacterium]|nr:hypothetical protein [Desulfobacteraceae bacterium]
MARVKVKTGEDFSDDKIEKVISLLAKGETKKSCCDFLGMHYNTSRLNKVVQNYKEKKELQKNMRKSLRNKAIDKQDITYICQAYLDGEPLSEISNNIYRTTAVVKNVLERYGIPLRNASNNYYNPIFINDETPDDYMTGDLVFSARYNSMAEIIRKVKDGVYRIGVFGKNQQYAYQPYYELADLRKLQDDLHIKGSWEKDTRQRAWQAVLNAKTNKKGLKSE